MSGWFRAWMDFIEYFYNGCVFAFQQAGEAWKRRFPSRINNHIQGHLNHRIACMAAGDATRSPYAWSLLRHGTRYGARGYDPAPYRVQ